MSLYSIFSRSVYVSQTFSGFHPESFFQNLTVFPKAHSCVIYLLHSYAPLSPSNFQKRFTHTQCFDTYLSKIHVKTWVRNLIFGELQAIPLRFQK